MIYIFSQVSETSRKYQQGLEKNNVSQMENSLGRRGRSIINSRSARIMEMLFSGITMGESPGRKVHEEKSQTRVDITQDFKGVSENWILY